MISVTVGSLVKKSSSIFDDDFYMIITPLSNRQGIRLSRLIQNSSDHVEEHYDDTLFMYKSIYDIDIQDMSMSYISSYIMNILGKFHIKQSKINNKISNYKISREDGSFLVNLCGSKAQFEYIFFSQAIRPYIKNNNIFDIMNQYLVNVYLNKLIDSLRFSTIVKDIKPIYDEHCLLIHIKKTHDKSPLDKLINTIIDNYGDNDITLINNDNPYLIVKI